MNCEGDSRVADVSPSKGTTDLALEPEVVILEVGGAPGAIPTRDLPLRRRTLYATELREHIALKLTDTVFACLRAGRYSSYLRREEIL